MPLSIFLCVYCFKTFSIFLAVFPYCCWPSIQHPRMSKCSPKQRNSQELTPAVTLTTLFRATFLSLLYNEPRTLVVWCATALCVIEKNRKAGSELPFTCSTTTVTLSFYLTCYFLFFPRPPVSIEPYPEFVFYTPAVAEHPNGILIQWDVASLFNSCKSPICIWM